MLLHRAPLVVPVGRAPLEDGALLVDNGVLVAVDRYARLQGAAPVRDHEGMALLPALWNCHTHLELSHLGEVASRRKENERFFDWVRRLLDARQKSARGDEIAAARKQLDRFYRQGVTGLIDIGNLPQSGAIGKDSPLQILFFLELLGLSEQRTEQLLAEVEHYDGNCTAHAPYSTGSRLLCALKERARSRGALFPIHVAESSEESCFLLDACGPLRDFVEERGGWDGSFHPPGCGPVAYLHQLGLLDERTLCVHAVQVSAAECELLAASGTQVCLCPTSNRVLGVGCAPLGIMLAAGLTPCLGTDSAASNPAMNMWQEMRQLAADHPGVDPARILEMATVNGARCCGMEDAGTLASGHAARFIAVKAVGVKACEIESYLVSTGGEIAACQHEGGAAALSEQS